jgi:hypothetical protein
MTILPMEANWRKNPTPLASDLAETSQAAKDKRIYPKVECAPARHDSLTE